METQVEGSVGYPVEQEPIVLSKGLMDTLLAQEKPSDLIALYTFYYYTAKWQKTNQPKATISYVAKGLGWGEQRVRSAKTRLRKLGLLEDVRQVDPKSGKSVGWYIKLQFIWKKENHPHSLPQGGNNHRVENKQVNALSANSKNALSPNREKEDTNVSFGSYQTHPESIDRIISFWGRLPKGRRHRKGTKIYSQIVTQVENLLDGLPVLCTKDGLATKPLRNFFERHRINPALLNKTWTTDEIIDVLQKVHDEDLSEPRDLPSIFWNRFAHREKAYSLFLAKADTTNVPTKYVKYAKKLAEILNPSLDQSRLMNWSKDLEEMLVKEGVSESVLADILSWYEDHIDDQFTPKSDDAREFCVKFRRIQRAKERQEQDDNNEYPDYTAQTPEHLMW